MTAVPGFGLYAVTDTGLTRERGVVACVRGALEGGARMVQYRDKGTDRPRRSREAAAIRDLCRRHGVPFIVNDDLDLALEVGADGVHVGRDDDAVETARATLGAGAIVGASCYHELDRARQAVAAGASYVAFGRFHASRTKPGRALAGPELLRAARAELAVPVVAIGGITAGNGAALVAAGANLLAVIHDLWGDGDCAARARALAACFD